MNIILLEPQEVESATVTLGGPRAKHLLEVLKVAPGSTVRVGVVDGPLGTASVDRVEAQTVHLTVALDAGSPPSPMVDLLLALPRPKVLRRLWAQLAALGVGRIILTGAARVERYYFDTHVLDEQCWRPLLIEGLQQARDTWLPDVRIHRRFQVCVEDEIGPPDGTIRLFAHPGSGRSVQEAVASHSGGRVVLAVGPEGGWTPHEMHLLAAHGFSPVTLGPRTLRTDTACVALLALAHDAVRRAA